MTGEFSESWLSLREPADAAARSAELAGMLPEGIHTVRDLGCGTGSLARWLAPLLPGAKRWILMDRDPFPHRSWNSTEWSRNRQTRATKRRGRPGQQHSAMRIVRTSNHWSFTP